MNPTSLFTPTEISNTVEYIEAAQLRGFACSAAFEYSTREEAVDMCYRLADLGYTVSIVRSTRLIITWGAGLGRDCPKISISDRPLWKRWLWVFNPFG